MEYFGHRGTYRTNNLGSWLPTGRNLLIEAQGRVGGAVLPLRTKLLTQTRDPASYVRQHYDNAVWRR
jgi:hypothetical protein